MSDLTGYSLSRINQLAAAEFLPRAEKGRYILRPCVQAMLVKRLSPIESQKVQSCATPGEQVPDEQLSDKDRKLKAEADLAEMEAKQQKGLLVNGPAPKTKLGARDIAVEDRLLAVPMAGAARAVEAAEKTGVNGVAEVYKREIRAVLADLASAALVARAEPRG